jgi:predicted helicase
VNFIVRGVDDILKNEFDLPNGLADNSKTKIKVNLQATDNRYKDNIRTVEQEVHKVQILDPATGTGTFLAEVVKHIHKKFEGQQGIWSNYVATHLLPRLNGFELLMASYAMAHLQLDLLLTETNYKPSKDQRFRVYLTNSLEESHPDTGTLFANWLSTEANEANHIKRDTPVMCVIGNPPYSGESANKGEWIMKLMEDYKKEPGGKEKLKEQNSKFINDDYVKFLRYGQHFIEKNGSGVLAFINPHGFLDNPTFRGMRWHLLKTYDKIYTIDLHGNSNQGEVSPDGSADVNVFDIKQGVSINIFVKTGKKKTHELGKVFHHDIYGKREVKYDFLFDNSLKSTPFKQLEPIAPNYFFVNKNNEGKEDYEKGFSPKDLFLKNVLGFQTHRDDYALSYEKQNIVSRAMQLRDKNVSNDEIYKKHNLKDNRDWNLSKARIDIQNDLNWDRKIMRCEYRPFDSRWCYFSYVAMDYPRKELLQHVAERENSVLIVSRQCTTDWRYIFVSNKVIEANLTGTAGRYGAGYAFPLYSYSETNGQQTIGHTAERTPNLNTKIVKQIAEKLGLAFTNEKETTKNTFAPIDILDYIYAVLHSPTYREKYKEFLKIDFPKVLYPKDKNTFWQLVKLGEQIRQIHLLESPTVEKHITQYPIDGDNIVTKPKYQDGKVYLNDTQYFNNVPQIAWEFYIGGYQPAQKWLKDRKERKLEFDDILHYQKIIVALSETDRLMKEIDKIDFI